MFKGLREKYGRLTDDQQTAVMSAAWLSILQIVFFTWIISGSSVFRVLSIVMMAITGIAGFLGSFVIFSEESDKQKNAENLEE